MRIDYLQIQNFRGIRSFEITNLSKLNVIAGINGAGKTSILVAIKILLSWYVARIRNAKGRGINILDKDITQGEQYCFLKLRLDNGIEWQIYKKRAGLRSAIPADSLYKTSMSQMMDLANGIAESMSTHPETTDITLVDAYGVNRVVNETPMRVRKTHKLQPIDALSVDMSNSVNFHDFFIWFREMEDIENEQMRATGQLRLDPRLEAIRRAVPTLLEGYDQLRVQRNPRAFVLQKGDLQLDFNQLSDGEKSYLSLVLDIARKMAMTHPTLSLPLEGDGIVLIDEIDLHLHPTWQREVISRLQQLFPHCQFLLTTHSPHIVSCVNLTEGDKLIAVRQGHAHEIRENQYGQVSDRVLTEIFEMNSLRNPVAQQHIDHLWAILDKRAIHSEEYTTELDWLKSHIDASDPVFGQINLQVALINKGMA